MKSTIVTSGSNNYTNLRFKTKMEAKITRLLLRNTLKKDKVDPYYEASRTVRVYIKNILIYIRQKNI